MSRIKGLQTITTNDGVRIVRLHYTADPAKDPATPEGQSWLARELVGYPGGRADPRWRREMEIDFDAYGGELLFPWIIEYETAIRCEPIREIPPHWEISAGLDYGTRNPSAMVITGWDRKTGLPTTFWEYYQQPRRKDEDELAFRRRKGYQVLAQAIREGPYWDYMRRQRTVIVADASMWNKTQETKYGLRSVADLLADEGIPLTPAAKGRGSDMAWYELVSSRLWANPKLPLWHITRNCTWLWRELSNLRFADHSPSAMETHNQRDEIVDKDNHATDALKYDFLSHYQILDTPPDTRSRQDKRLDRLYRREVDDFEREFGEDSLDRYRETLRRTDELYLIDDDPDEEYGTYYYRPDSQSLGLKGRRSNDPH